MPRNIAKNVIDETSDALSHRLSFDTEASVERGRRIIEMYSEMGVPKERVLIKLAATWEGILAAEILEKEGIQCNLTLIFSVVQAIACAQRGSHLISPFPGRVLDWYKAKEGRTEGVDPEEDEGVVACKEMYNYFKVSGGTFACWVQVWLLTRLTRVPCSLVEPTKNSVTITTQSACRQVGGRRVGRATSWMRFLL